MNADSRANPGTGPTFSPRVDEGPSEVARTPQRSSLRPITSEVPVSGQQPVSGRQQTGGPFAPVSSSAPVTRAPSAPSSAPTSGSYPVSEQHTTSGAAGGVSATAAAGFDKLKGFAAKAKDELTSADDIAASERKGGPRKVRVLVSRIDPWSALKIGFLLSIAIGIMMVVAVYVLWGALNSLGVFALANEWVQDLFTDGQDVNILQFFALNKWMSATVLMAVVNVVLLTALATLGAFLYNTISKVVGGIYVTLTDD